MPGALHCFHIWQSFTFGKVNLYHICSGYSHKLQCPFRWFHASLFLLKPKHPDCTMLPPACFYRGYGPFRVMCSVTFLPQRDEKDIFWSSSYLLTCVCCVFYEACGKLRRKQLSPWGSFIKPRFLFLGLHDGDLTNLWWQLHVCCDATSLGNWILFLLRSE